MKRKMFSLVFAVLLIGAMVLGGCSSAPYEPAPSTPTETTTTTSTATSSSTSAAPTAPSTSQSVPTAPAPTIVTESGGTTAATSPSFYHSEDDTIGLAVGGAKDVENFRENIENGYLPLPSDITCEGLFYEYYFDTGQSEPCDQLYCPSYSVAAAEDPFSGKTEYYLSVGLNSGLKESDFERKPLNLVVVLDVSGSMNEEYDRYYYDSAGQRVDLYESSEGRMTKIESATESVVTILDQLDDDDRFGLVTFNTSANVVTPLYSIDDTDVRELRRYILDIRAGGSTNLGAGMEAGTDLFDKYRIDLDDTDYENRIIFLTDAMPNTGEISGYQLFNMVERNANNRLYSTFIGVGIDFNSALIEQITKTRGANYYSVHSPEQFRIRMEDEFDYMVTPLVFDLELKLDSSAWRIDEVYGSPEADEASGTLMYINTLFPSSREGGETKGGLVLLKLRKRSVPVGDAVTLTVTYEDRTGASDRSRATIYIEDIEEGYFDNSGIRKGVLLARYSTLLQDWMIDESEHMHYSAPWKPMVTEEDGICKPPSFSQWERKSLPLVVSPWYGDLFEEFADYMEDEIRAIGDRDLYQELDTLEYLDDIARD